MRRMIIPLNNIAVDYKENIFYYNIVSNCFKELSDFFSPLGQEIGDYSEVFFF